MEYKYIITLILLAILFTGCTTNSKVIQEVGTQEQEIIIGVSLPLTGGLSFIGQSGQKAMLLALDEVNAKYDGKYNFRLIFEDDSFSPSNAITTTQKLIGVNNVDAIVSYGSPTGIVIAPIAQENRIPHIGIASVDIASQGSYNFNHWTPPSAQGKKLVQQLRKTGITKISAITLNHEGGMAIRDAVFAELERSGFNILQEEKFDPGTTDFRTIWKKIESSNPEIVFFVATSPEFESILKQRIEMGIDLPVVTVESPDYTDQPELYDGNWFINAAEPQEDFVEKFQARYNSDPRVFSGNAYDIVHVLADSFANEQNTPVQNLLAIQNYHGAMGEMSANEDGTFVTEAIVKYIKDGTSIKVN